MKYACLAAALATTWLALPAEAARFATPNDRSIVISGRIDPGDEAHFLSSLSRLRRGGTIEVHLSSPGGSVLAAMKIADIVHQSRSDHPGSISSDLRFRVRSRVRGGRDPYRRR